MGIDLSTLLVSTDQHTGYSVKTYETCPVYSLTSEALSYIYPCKEYSEYYDDDQQLIGYNKNEASEKLYSKGVNRVHNKDFAGAKKYFNSAYRACEAGYHNEAKFRANGNAMDLAIEGQKLFRAGQYDAGQSKFQEAEETAESSDVKHVLQSYFVRKSADEGQSYLNNGQYEKLVETYFTQGINAAENGDFESAKEHFDTAYQKCTSDYPKKSMFAANRDAMTIAIEGKNHLNSEQYEAAESKFKEAADKAATSDIKHVMQNQAKVTGDKLARNKLAETYYTQGVNAVKNGFIASAKGNFEKAYKRCTSDYSKKTMFAANRDAMSLVFEATQLFNLDEFEEGKDKLKTAMTKIIDTKKEFTAQVESKTAKMLENRIKSRNDLITEENREISEQDEFKAADFIQI